MIRLRPWLLLLATWLLLTTGTAAASGTAAVAVAAREEIPLGKYLRLLHDPAGELDLMGAMEAAASGAFVPPHSTTPSLGFREGATWVHFRLHNESAAPVERWLRSNWPLLQRATLYLVDAAGTVRRLENGSSIPLRDRPLAAQPLLYPVRLAPEESVDAYLRIDTRSTTIVDLTLWEPAAYANGYHIDSALRFFISGSTLVVIVFSLLAWQARRRGELLSLAVAQVCMMGLTLGVEGYFVSLLPVGDGLWQARVTWLLFYLAIAFQSIFARHFLQLPAYFPSLVRAMTGITWFCFAMAFVALTDYQPTLLAGISVAAMSSLTVVSVLAGWRLGHAGRVYFAAWGLLWAMVILRMLQHLGFADRIPFLGTLPVFAFGIASLAFSWALYLDIRNVRRDSDAAQRQLLALQHTEQERLLAAVANRTHELQEAMSRAEAANQAKTSFLSVVSHELRTPLHTILGYTQLLQRQLAGEARDKLAIVANSSAQLLSLIDDVLDFSRGEAFSVDLQLEPVGLRRLCLQLEESSRLLAGRRNNRFTVDLAEGLPTAVLADEQRLLQLLQNLIGNACKYTERGDIRLIVTPEPAAVCDTPEGTWYRLRFTVADSGPGIPRDEQEHIFEPFTRASSRQRQPGVGLGLAIARQLARAMGGDITVDSQPGSGSRFHVVLPLLAVALEENQALPVDSTAITGYQGRRLTLLVADDIAENRTILKEMFTRLGFSVVTADDGAEALDRCEIANPPIDAALVDQFMPNMDGWDFLRAVRLSPALANLPVFLISAATPKRPADLPPEIDFDHKLMKPLRLDLLASLLQQRLGFAWTADPATAASNGAAACRFPPAAQLAEFRDMLALGKVLALQRWSQALAQRSPEYAVFCERVVNLSRSVDLAGLKRLLDEAEGEAG